MPQYLISGLAVTSDVVLPGAVPLVGPAREPEVTIRRGAVPADLPAASAHGPTWAMSANEFLLRVPNVARFLINQGREIVFESEAETPDRDLTIFLLGSAFGILLHQRGEMVVHASGVSVHGKAVLFCGPSGCGKSTLAATLVARGYPFLNDDVCAIGFDADVRPQAHPDGRTLKLWAHALANLPDSGPRGDAVRTAIQKFFVTLPSEPVASPLPVVALYHLREERPPHRSGIESVNLPDAALLLRRLAYRPPLIQRMGLVPKHFSQVARVLRHAAVFHLTRPLDFAALPDVIAGLEAHWRELGFLGVTP